MITMSNNKQSGAVSLFVVIFAMLIITVITVSFLRLMMADQQRASDTDLSQSAYDSAMAGVEDAKRALLRYQAVCANTPSDCAALSSRLSSDTCNEALLEGSVVNPSDVEAGSGSNPGEVNVRQSITGNDASLNQAYTCVTIQLETQRYVGTLAANESQLVPLIGTNDFDTVTVRWFDRDDVGRTDGAVSLTALATQQRLLQQWSASGGGSGGTGWPTNRPSVMRTQLIQFGDSFTLSSFDIVNSSSQNNASTLFLYPVSGGSASSPNSDAFVGRDIRKNDANDDPDADSALASPLPVRCVASVSGGGFACSMSLRLPTPIGGGDRTAFLRLSPFYNASHFEVVLSNGVPLTTGANVVRFKDVQPIVDSTGRANDVFRRVQTNVDLFDTSFPYPDASIDVTNNFCKDFAVTNDAYFAGSCTP